MPQDNDASDSVFVAKESCPGCGSRDNLARYSDGHAHCFSPSCDYYERADGEKAGELAADAASRPRREAINPLPYDVVGLPKRGLTEATCRFWDYGIGEFNGQPCHLAHYKDPTSRELLAQKIRTGGKDFPVLKADGVKLPLYGQHLWHNDRRSLIITEGELDAMSVSQVQQHKYPVVSLTAGAKNAPNDIKRHYEWICEFDKIVLMFDMDEQGRWAAEACADLLPVGKVFVATLEGYKDANEALVDGKPSAITSAFWGAKPYQPEGIYTLEDIEEEVLAPIEEGRPWFLPTLTRYTFGRRVGEVHYLGAGTGIGKTDWFTQSIAFDVLELNIKTGCIYLEQPPSETGKRLAGKVAGKHFHLPNGTWTQDELKETFDRLKATGNLFLGGNFASADWPTVKSRIRFMAVSMGVEHFYLDHLTALADPHNERESLEVITKELALLAQELKIIMHVISHLSTPDGKPHEEGGRVMMRHFKGSRAIGFWAHNAFGMERNPHADDPKEAQQTIFRVLKCRYVPGTTGKTIALDYDNTTGQLVEGSFIEPDKGFEGQSLEV